MTKQTPLYAAHVDAGAKMVDFAGWQMPLHYGSQINEHKQVRQAAGQFDVSHMTVIDFTGSEALAFLMRAVANNVGKLTVPGRALYGVLLNHAAGVIDDLIVYRLEWGYRAVVNAGTRDQVLAWLDELGANASGTALVMRERPDLAIIAIQGPAAVDRAINAFDQLAPARELTSFQVAEMDDWMVARTGYTGEDGFELIVPNGQAEHLFQTLNAAGVPPIGLGARDSLRLEAGLNLYGQDMDRSVHPLAANLAWTISWKPEDRDFVGRAELAKIRASGDFERLVGVLLQDRGVLRAGQELQTDAGPGVLTSGAFSPTLGYSIGLARVPQNARGMAEVQIRNRMLPVTLVKPPFVRNGKAAHKPL